MNAPAALLCSVIALVAGGCAQPRARSDGGLTQDSVVASVEICFDAD